MTADDTCRIIIETAPQPGAWNMAVDEVLLNSAMERNVCSLRFYRWAVPTISLGYFQSASAGNSDPRLNGLPVVRRLSGGGAILHHHEWTYSCALPQSLVPMNLREVYAAVHEAIIAVLAGFGLRCRLRGDNGIPGNAPFLCFSRGDRCDIVLEGAKVGGSAQRRRRGCLLQHGSLLLRQSSYAPQHPGIFDLAPNVRFDAEQLPAELSPRIASRLAPNFAPASLSVDERRLAERLQVERYSQVDWRVHRAGTFL